MVMVWLELNQEKTNKIAPQSSFQLYSAHKTAVVSRKTRLCKLQKPRWRRGNSPFEQLLLHARELQSALPAHFPF